MWILIKESDSRLRSNIKVGAIVVLLLILVVGSLLQIYDCFNDAPNVDHDALLHTIDAFISVAMILALNVVLFWALAMLRIIWDPLERLQFCFSLRSCVDPAPTLEPQVLALRI